MLSNQNSNKLSRKCQFDPFLPLLVFMKYALGKRPAERSGVYFNYVLQLPSRLAIGLAECEIGRYTKCI